jgi:MoaA/NifB/PqqE/SkfB family radical SAM enzyme
LGVIGNAREESLAKIWNSPKRLKWLKLHKSGKRNAIPLCSYCHFWGVPTSGDYNNRNIKIKEKFFI